MTTRDDALALDAADPLAPLRGQFALPEGVIYLDGNSLGVLPAATADRVRQVVTEEWGTGLIRSWNSAGWITLPQRVGDKVARLVGARPGELVVADSTSVNLFKVLAAALTMASEDAPARKVILSERSNFPTDLYIAEALCQERGYTLRLMDNDGSQPQVLAELAPDVAVLMLTHVNYRTGAMHDMAAITAAAPLAGITYSAHGQLVDTQSRITTSWMNMPAAIQPSRPPPRMMIHGKRSISLSTSVLQYTMIGMLTTRPKMISVQLSLAAPATASGAANTARIRLPAAGGPSLEPRPSAEF